MEYRRALNSFIQLLETKNHLIDKLDLTDDQKEKLKVFFKVYPNYENKIDWNRKDLSWGDFQELLANAGKSKSQAKKKGLAGLREGIDYKLIYRRPGLAIYRLLSHLGARVIASPKVDPPIEGKWCIATNDDNWWTSYTSSGFEFFIICFLDNWTPESYNEDLDVVPDKYAIMRRTKRSFNPAYIKDFTQMEALQVWDSSDSLIDEWTAESVEGDPLAEEIYNAIMACPRNIMTVPQEKK